MQEIPLHITLESILNFEVGQTVILNPDNHGYKMLGMYLKVKDRLGTVRKVYRTGPKGEGSRTGEIDVIWEMQGGKIQRYNYKNLKILREWDLNKMER